MGTSGGIRKSMCLMKTGDTLQMLYYIRQWYYGNIVHLSLKTKSTTANEVTYVNNLPENG